MSRKVIVEYDGKRVTLMQLAKSTGIKYETLSARHHKGDRGARLIRPREAGGSTAITTEEGDDLKHQRQVKDFQRIKEAERLAWLRERQERRRELKARANAELAAVVARPLIDAGLLTTAERKGIRERVRLSGQRAWSIKGTGGPV